MFVGAIPRQVISQLLDVVPLESFSEVYVCCSGSFRLERSIRQRHPSLALHGNDVSLLTCALGRLAVGKPLAFRFVEQLAWLEETLAGADSTRRLAGIVVASEIARYSSASLFAERYREHYRSHIDDFLDRALTRLGKILSELSLAGFRCGDFREHADRAVEARAFVVASPPTYKSGYERLYKFIDANTDWERPAYEVWDPKHLGDWIRSLEERNAAYAVVSDQVLEGLNACVEYSTPRMKTLYVYANARACSLRRSTHRAIPFQYRPVDPCALTRDTKVALVPVDAAKIMFLRHVYLSNKILPSTGDLNFLVYLDDCLAGAFCYQRDRRGAVDQVYLLSDFAITRAQKVSKLIALLATSRAAVRRFEMRNLARITSVFTTAFTDRPASMKYRSVFRVYSRRPGLVNYQSPVRDESPQQLYRRWWDKTQRVKHCGDAPCLQQGEASSTLAARSTSE